MALDLKGGCTGAQRTAGLFSQTAAFLADNAKNTKPRHFEGENKQRATYCFEIVKEFVVFKNASECVPILATPTTVASGVRGSRTASGGVARPHREGIEVDIVPRMIAPIYRA